MRLIHYVTLVFVALALGCKPKTQPEYQFALRSTDGLRRGSLITFLGVKVGFISDLRLSSDGQSVIARGCITESNMRILQGDAARVSLPGLLADAEIEISRGNLSGAELPVGSTINVSPFPTVSLSPEKEKAVAEAVRGLVNVLTNGLQRGGQSK